MKLDIIFIGKTFFFIFHTNTTSLPTPSPVAPSFLLSHHSSTSQSKASFEESPKSDIKAEKIIPPLRIGSKKYPHVPRISPGHTDRASPRSPPTETGHVYEAWVLS